LWNLKEVGNSKGVKSRLEAFTVLLSVGGKSKGPARLIVDRFMPPSITMYNVNEYMLRREQGPFYSKCK
jgi:hypothetical protein